MYITNASSVQATIEIFAVAAILLIAIIFVSLTRIKNSSAKILLIFLLVVATGILNDALWYLYDGNDTLAGVVVNRTASFIVFLANPIMLFLAALYMYALIDEKGEKASRRFFIGNAILVCIDTIGLFANIRVRWIYDFTKDNVYFRLPGWFIYDAICTLSVIFLFIFVLKHRKAIGSDYTGAIMVFIIAPFAGMFLQILFIGLSFIYLGLGIGVLCILFVYMKRWILGADNLGNSKYKNGFVMVVGCLLIMILLISASIVSCLVSIISISQKNVMKNNESVIHMVSGSIENEFVKPITVSQAIAVSSEIIDALELHELEDTPKEARMVRFMNDIRDEFGYQMVFCVSEHTKGYYTYQGLSRYTNRNYHDFWYPDFIKSGKKYELNVDTDEDQGKELAVFVNTIVKSRDGEVLGCAGVGVNMQSLSDLLNSYEQQFNADISLINADGLVLVDTEVDNIERKKMNLSYIPEITTEEVYVHEGKHIQMSLYLDSLDMYLIVTFFDDSGINIPRLVLPSVSIFFVGLGMMLIAVWVFYKLEISQDAELKQKTKMAEEDELTELLNRNAYEQRERMLVESELSPDFSVVMLDINGLKEANDQIGHDAGDELIIATAACLKKVFDASNIYRIGGDEFIILGEYTQDEISDTVESLRQIISQWSGSMNSELACSIGYARMEDYENMTYKGLQHKADELMYADKNEYYRRTGKNRRAF